MSRNMSCSASGGWIMWNLEAIMFLCQCAWVCLVWYVLQAVGGVANTGRGRQMGLLCTDSSVPYILTFCHLAPSLCIIRVVVWVAKPCGVILNVLQKSHALHIIAANKHRHIERKTAARRWCMCQSSELLQGSPGQQCREDNEKETRRKGEISFSVLL